MLKIIVQSYFRISLLMIFSFCSSNAKSQNKEQLIIDLQKLSSKEMEGRKTGSAGHRSAQKYIVNRYNAIGLVPLGEDFNQYFKLSTRSSELVANNLIGMIPGTSEGSIVISAHYDHLGMKEGKIYYGADDNASGVAALFFIADYFNKNKPNHTLVFAAFDAEEGGLVGAKYFVENLENREVIFNVNMDMISRSQTQEIYACGTRYSSELQPVLSKINLSNVKVSLLLGHDGKSKGQQDWTYNSDHGPFHKAGIPFIYFGVEDHADYHRPSDTFDKIDTAFYNNVVDMILEFVKEIDKQIPE